MTEGGMSAEHWCLDCGKPATVLLTGRERGLKFTDISYCDEHAAELKKWPAVSVTQEKKL